MRSQGLGTKKLKGGIKSHISERTSETEMEESDPMQNNPYKTLSDCRSGIFAIEVS
jgi:hypothetical protein